ncbi:YwmB family TATA-box binding protein [Oceanobacillus bengalensis]|uniref:TATA-box binding n=1 Tax=Oceanobacillus bengalensis TaxID=1435466 RepID=A0A494YYT4_9BACI|nr:YwmB family TATA-box binding protein [Oceanobacillus bengalensis]RKQ15354.1 hypothetical protein D8M05_10165 [Oceanobacillus bengalensis]
MWKIVLITIIMLFTANATTVQGSESHDIFQLAGFFEDADIEIGQWQVMIKEQKTITDIERILDELQDSYKGSRTEEETVIKYQFRDPQIDNNMSVLYNIVIPKDNLTYPELIVVFEGNNWGQEVKETYLMKESICMEFFTDSRKIFSWMNAMSSDIIIEGEFQQKLTNYFNLQQINTHFDNTPNSVSKKFVYGYTTHINEQIIIERTPINVQVAITKNEKGITELTVGTPILINEY